MIRPLGLIQVQTGTEAEFLFHQDVRILPGMGPKLLKTAAVTGIREIGEIAALSLTEVLSLFGKHGPLLRELALGIDGSLVEDRSGKKAITQQADFNEDVIDETEIRAAIETLAANGGLAMRKNKHGATLIKMVIVYSDGMRAEGQEKAKRSFILDREISAAAERIFFKAAVRRLRLRSIGLSLEGLMPLGYEPDLFEPETESSNRKLQEAVDKIQERFGMGKIARGLVLAASPLKKTKQLISAGAGKYAH
jgi:DNA polymerase-4